MTQAVPGNAAYWFRLGNSDARLGQPQPAAGAYRAALQRNPHLAPAWRNLGSVLLKQAQAAYVEAADNAQSTDPLQSKSATRAARIRALRAGDFKRNPAAHSKTETDSPATRDEGASPVEHEASHLGTRHSRARADRASLHSRRLQSLGSQGDGS